MIRKKTDFHIMLTYRYQGTYYTADIIDCVEKYRLQCGPENPIRYMEMSVNRNKVVDMYPNLMDNIVEGETRLYIHAVGTAQMIVTKIWLTEYTYEFLASGLEINLNTSIITSPRVGMTPKDITNAIFASWNKSQEGKFHAYYSRTSYETKKITIEQGMALSLALQICGLADDAFVYFADKWDDVTKDYVDTMYYVSYGDIQPISPNPIDPVRDGQLNIYPKLDDHSRQYSATDIKMFKGIIDLSSKESEASTTIINSQYVQYYDGAKMVTVKNQDNPYTVATGNDYTGASKSIGIYGEYEGKMISSSLLKIEVGNESIAQNIANNMVRRYRDPSRSIIITMSEGVTDATGDAGWERAFDPFCFARSINDEVNQLYLTDRHYCDGISDNFILRLSTFIHNYPELTTTYQFGVSKSSSLSQILADLEQQK